MKSRIVLSAAGFYPHSFGGGETYVYRTARELMRRGHDVSVLTFAPPKNIEGPLLEYYYDDIMIVVLRFDSGAVSPVESHTGLGPTTCATVRLALGRIEPDLVHINALKPPLVAVCRELGVPHLVTAHHAGIVCPTGGLLRKDGSICPGQVSGQACVPCCASVRWPRWYTGGIIGRLPERLYRPIGRSLNENRGRLGYLERGLIYPWLTEQSITVKMRVLDDAMLMIAPSKYMKDLLLRNGSSAERIRLIPHGIEPLLPVAHDKAVGRTVRFGYVGRIDPGKGLHLLLQAVRLLPDVPKCEVHIFGAARNIWDEQHFRRILRDYRGRNSVISHGLVPPDRLSEAFASFDVLVVPSLLPESFGLVVLEAFSAGRPVIVFDSGALPELVRDGVDGIIVRERSAPALAKAMRRFIDHPELIRDMAREIQPVRTMREHVDDLERVYRLAFSSAAAPVSGEG